MKERIKRLLFALSKRNAPLAEQLTVLFTFTREADYADFLVRLEKDFSQAAAVEDSNELQSLAGSRLCAEAQQSPALPSTTAEASALVASAAAIRPALTELKAELEKACSSNLVDAKLAKSKLPTEAMFLVRQCFAGKVCDEAAIDSEIKRVRAAFAAMSPIGRVRSTGIKVGLETRDKMQSAMDGMLGVKEALADPNVRPFKGIKEAYMFITGDRELRFGSKGIGGFQRVSESVSTTDFPNILLDSMFKRLVQDYNDVGMGGLEQVIMAGPALADFRTQSRIRMGYFGDLPSVAEAGLYTELVKPSDEKITYNPLKKGALLTVSEETIRADDLGKIRLFPERLARAGRHTLKTFVSNFFINNMSYMADGVSWFNASHNNLISAPLSVDTLIDAEVTLMKQTEKDSGNRLAQRISWLMVPVDLTAIAWEINNGENYNPGPMITKPNPFYKRFGEPGSGANAPRGVVVNELLTDTNDWYFGVDVSEVPALEIAYLDGIANPQIFLADLQTQGTQFTNDQIQYKAKFSFGGAILDYRGVGKAAVP